MFFSVLNEVAAVHQLPRVPFKVLVSPASPSTPGYCCKTRFVLALVCASVGCHCARCPGSPLSKVGFSGAIPSFQPLCNVLGSCCLAGDVPSSAMVPSRCCKNLKAGSGLVAGCHLPGSHEWHPLILPLDLATIRDALVLDELSHGSLETKPVFYGL